MVAKEIASYKSTLKVLSIEELRSEVDSKEGIEKILIADELICRKQIISGFIPSFEHKLRSISAGLLSAIDQFDHLFSKASVHVAIDELGRRKKHQMQWYYSYEGDQRGPYNRVELENIVAQMNDSDIYIWKEGFESWVELDRLSYIKEPLFFKENKSDANPGRIVDRQHWVKERKNPNNSAPLIIGIFQMIAFPFWGIMTLVMMISGLNSFTGYMLPLAFCLFMGLASIPLGIGLMTGRSWAFHMKAATSILAVSWFIGRVVVDDAGVFWIFIAMFESLFLILLVANKEGFSLQYKS